MRAVLGSEQAVFGLERQIWTKRVCPDLCRRRMKLHVTSKASRRLLGIEVAGKLLAAADALTRAAELVLVSQRATEARSCGE